MSLVDRRFDLHVRQVRAMMNSSGACRLAATVWPTSTLRLMTTPSTGEVMPRARQVHPAWASVAWRWATLAWADCTWAWATPTCACTALSASVLVLTKARLVGLAHLGNELLFHQAGLAIKVTPRLSSRSTWARETWVLAAKRAGLSRHHRSRGGIDIGLCRNAPGTRVFRGRSAPATAFLHVGPPTVTDLAAPTCETPVSSTTGLTAPLAATVLPGCRARWA